MILFLSWSGFIIKGLKLAFEAVLKIVFISDIKCIEIKIKF